MMNGREESSPNARLREDQLAGFNQITAAQDMFPSDSHTGQLERASVHSDIRPMCPRP